MDEPRGETSAEAVSGRLHSPCSESRIDAGGPDGSRVGDLPCASQPLLVHERLAVRWQSLDQVANAHLVGKRPVGEAGGQ